ncbi:hypothetical protein SPKIRA_18490 [Sphingomonas paucimobilis]|nr:hypothetical protein SPKIRA_18490 [Sphingomonas paucimobilis]
MTAPAPIASVRVLDVQKIRTENFPEGSGENLVLTGDQNIIDLTYSVRWDIANPRDFAFRPPSRRKPCAPPPKARCAPSSPTPRSTRRWVRAARASSSGCRI